jgi:GT2 family glycosyltransferase
MTTTASTEDRTDLWLTIPTGGRDQYLEDIVDNSGIPRERIVIVNTDANKLLEGVHNLWDFDEVNIHRWWNKGIKFAKERGARYVAVLNDDLALEDNPLNTIANAMEETKSAIGFPYPHTGHICGYCYILNVETGLMPDESYRWWFGDNDLYLRAKKFGGSVGVLAKVRHLHGNELTSINHKLLAQTEEDKKLFYSRLEAGYYN